MTKVKNISDGPKGVRLAAAKGQAGAIVMLEPGESQDLDIADGEDDQTDWFEFGGKSGKSDDEPGPLDQSVEKLTAYLDTVNDADEVQKLIDAETAGKSRAGALAALKARQDVILGA
jgi:hypothetical protein